MSTEEEFKAPQNWGENVKKPEDIQPYRTLLRRLGAGPIDLACILLPTAGVLYCLHLFNVPARSLISLLLAQLFGVVWSVLFVGFTGTTPGKMLFGLRVAVMGNEDQKVSFARAIKRELLNLVTILMYAVMLSLSAWEGPVAGSSDAGLRYLVWEAAVVIEVIIRWSEILTALFNKRRRAIHDFIAGTVIVKSAIQRRGVTAYLLVLAICVYVGYVILDRQI
jgi:uncharacterized RDD family membrane protein YckC